MFNMGFAELLLLGAIALLVIGPKQLPEVARTLARLLNDLKRATGDLGETFFDLKSQARKPFDDIALNFDQPKASSAKLPPSDESSDEPSTDKKEQENSDEPKS